MRYTLLIVFFVLSIRMAFGQKELDAYKYVVVPYRYSFSSSDDQYRLSTLTRHELKQKGFDVYYNTESLPTDLTENNCLAAYADLEEGSGMFSTRLTLIFKDCRNNEIFRSVEGSSRLKSFNEAYKEAFDGTMAALMGYQYHYAPTAKSVPAATSPAGIAVATTPVVTTTASTSMEKMPSSTVVATESTNFLYAQPTELGYQLVDMSPKVVMRLKRTQTDKVFLIDGKEGVVFFLDGQWILNEYREGRLYTEELYIKF